MAYSPYTLTNFSGTLIHPLFGEQYIGGGNNSLETATLEYDTDTTTHDRMPDGTILVNFHRGSNGRLTLTQAQGSAADLWLDGLFNVLKTAGLLNNVATQASLTGLLTDNNTGAKYTLRGGSLSKPPNVTWTRDQPRRAWVLLIADITND